MIDLRFKRGPLGVDADVFVGAHSFTLGDLVAVTPSGFVLADNTDSTKVAMGWVAFSTDDSFGVVTGTRIVDWPDHGQGSAGDRLWLGTSGGYVSAAPAGSSVKVVQLVALVYDADTLSLFPPSPPTF